MKLDAAMLGIFLLSLVLVGASLFGLIHPTPYLTEYGYWILAGGYGLLSLGILLRSR